MNKLEHDYEEQVLKQRLRDAEIQGYEFQTLSLRAAAGKGNYIPDFVVVRADGVMELHECIGNGPPREKTLATLTYIATRWSNMPVKIVMRGDDGGWKFFAIRGKANS